MTLENCAELLIFRFIHSLYAAVPGTGRKTGPGCVDAVQPTMLAKVAARITGEAARMLTLNSSHSTG